MKNDTILKTKKDIKTFIAAILNPPTHGQGLKKAQDAYLKHKINLTN